MNLTKMPQNLFDDARAAADAAFVHSLSVAEFNQLPAIKALDNWGREHASGLVDYFKLSVQMDLSIQSSIQRSSQ